MTDKYLINHLRTLYNTNCAYKRKIKPSKWTEPNEKACTIYIGCDLNGEYLVSSKITKRQIDFVMSKESKLQFDGKIIHLNDILIERRKPISGLQHFLEFSKAVFEYLNIELLGPYLETSLKSKPNKTDFNSKLYKVSPLNHILQDRSLRVRLREDLADAPPIAKIRLEDDCIVMFELYCGHHGNQKRIHLKSHDFENASDEKEYIDSADDYLGESEYNIAGIKGISSDDLEKAISVAHNTMLCGRFKVLINGIEQ